MINIVFASDDNYSGYLCVALYSLLKNNLNEHIDIQILDDNISQKNKEKIINMTQSFENKNITFIDISDIIEDCKLNENLKKYLRKNYSTTYARLFLDFLLPPHVEKVLYLDCDILINDNLNELWNINIDNYYVAGVMDLMPNVYKEIIGLKPNSIYLNAGILLINMKKCRKENVWNDFFKFLEKHMDEDIHHDQGVINGVCNDKMLVIHPKFNYIGSLHVNKPLNVIKWYVDPTDYYETESINEAQKNTVIYHFCEGSLGRPWTNKKHKYYPLYREYFLKSGIDEKNIYKINDDKNMLNKLYLFLQTNRLGSLILNIIPKSIARRTTNTLLKLKL